MNHKQLKHKDERVEDDRKSNNEWVNWSIRRACKFTINFAKWIVRTRRRTQIWEAFKKRWRFIGQKLIFTKTFLLLKPSFHVFMNLKIESDIFSSCLETLTKRRKLQLNCFIKNCVRLHVIDRQFLYHRSVLGECLNAESWKSLSWYQKFHLNEVI